jgi:hypothetical protein
MRNPAAGAPAEARPRAAPRLAPAARGHVAGCLTAPASVNNAHANTSLLLLTSLHRLYQ